ncbi:hypothetical protein B7P43_G09569 [Cryptotermes secundus]|uniref:Uncharacterized protein n=1 Tax=Cryptotermes secundus TaxID=105785 RepID=A0A2J7RQA4_9NEOP|nr:hypothetical protein B7P43_G09569 [Cryptotermes secundus]
MRNNVWVYVPIYEEDSAENRLLLALHKAVQWSVELSPAEFSHDFRKQLDLRHNHQHGAYILFTSCRNETTVLGTSILAWQMEKLSLLSEWNPRARFLVVLCCNREGNDVLKLSYVKQIFLELRHVMVYNALVLVPSSSQRIQCYSWFPYNKTSKNCEEIRDIFLLDTWVSYGDRGMFLHSRFLYPEKFPTNIGGCPLRIATLIYPPHSFLLADKSHPLKVNGMEPQIISYIAQKMNASVEFRQHGYSDVRYNLSDSDSAIAIGNMKYDSDNSLQFDFTTPHYTDTNILYVPRATQRSRWVVISRVFVVSVWLLLFLTIILSSIMMRYLSGCLSLGFPQDGKHRSILKYLCISWSVLLGVPVPVIPLGNPFRVLFFFFVVFSLAINNVFQSSITSFLVDPGFEHQIDTFAELADSDLNIFLNERFEGYMYYTSVEGKRIISGSDINLLMQMAIGNKTSALFSSSATMSFTLRRNQSKYHALSDYSLQLHSIMLVKKGWPFLEPVNTVISRLVEGGIPNSIMSNITNQNIYRYRKVGVWNLITEYSSLSAERLQAAFFLLAAGLGVSFVAFAVEHATLVFKQIVQTSSQVQRVRPRFRPRRRKLLHL